VVTRYNWLETARRYRSVYDQVSRTNPAG